MILRNPAIRRDSFFKGTLTFLLAFAFPFLTFLGAQGIIGHVVESFSRQNISNAEVGVYQHDSLLMQTLTDSSGFYSIQSNVAGRVSVHIKHPDYADYVEQDLIIDGYSTLRLEHLLTIKSFDLPGVTVIANQKKNTDFVRTITPEDMVLVAGNFEDPVRIAHSQPGIVLLNDQANHLSARGQSPVFNNWYLEGLQIVNPNHTSNAGTLSDLPTQYGGGVNMFSSQILGNTEIYPGITPISLSQKGGAIIDMHLHETAKPEWRAKVGLIGFELGRGQKIGENGILDVNLRYSFTGLLTDLGADFGGEQIGFYDGVVSYLHQKNNHKLKLFSWAGNSFNHFNHVEPETDWERYKDLFDIDYDHKIFGAGGRYDLIMNHKVRLSAGAAYSRNESTYDKYYFNPEFPDSLHVYDRIHILSSFIEISRQHAESSYSSIGLQFLNHTRSFNSLAYPPSLPSYPFPDESILRLYIETKRQLSKSISLQLGGELSYSIISAQWNGGYWIQFQHRTGQNSLLIAGARGSAGEPVQQSSVGTYNNYYYSRNFELKWGKIREKIQYSFNLYWNHCSRLLVRSVDDNRNYYLPDYPLLPILFNVNEVHQRGLSNQYGIEGSWTYNPNPKWRFDFNQSFFKSERGSTDQPVSGGRYDNRYTTHLVIAKEIVSNKNGKNRIWNFSIRGLLNGGLWEETIDSALSDDFHVTVTRNPGNFTERLPAFKRIDASISRTISTPKIRWRYSLDIQNLFSLTNIAYHYYDPYLHEVKAQEQLGIIPVLSVQASW